MKLFAVCPFCGKKLLKAEESSKIEIQCPSCKEQVEIVIAKETVKACKCNVKIS